MKKRKCYTNKEVPVSNFFTGKVCCACLALRLFTSQSRRERERRGLGAKM